MGHGVTRGRSFCIVLFTFILLGLVRFFSESFETACERILTLPSPAQAPPPPHAHAPRGGR